LFLGSSCTQTGQNDRSCEPNASREGGGAWLACHTLVLLEFVNQGHKVRVLSQLVHDLNLWAGRRRKLVSKRAFWLLCPPPLVKTRAFWLLFPFPLVQTHGYSCCCSHPRWSTHGLLLLSPPVTHSLSNSGDTSRVSISIRRRFLGDFLRILAAYFSPVSYWTTEPRSFLCRS
jgi:hypothetical protein